MKVDKNSYMGGAIYWTGFHHINELLYLKSFLKKDMTFVDIGANQGEFSLFACKMLKEGNVLAFEPVKSQLDLLKESVKLNHFQNIQIYDFGLFDKPGQFEIYTSIDTKTHSGTNDGLSSLFKSEDRNELEQIVEVKVFDDVFFDDLTRLDFVKIDIEGSEFFALKGMLKTLQKFKPGILIEMNKVTFEEAGYTVLDVHSFLTDLGYKCYNIFRGRLFEYDIRDITEFKNLVYLSN